MRRPPDLDQIRLQDLLIDTKSAKVGFNHHLVDVMAFGDHRELLPKRIIDTAQLAA